MMGEENCYYPDIGSQNLNENNRNKMENSPCKICVTK